MTNKVTRRNAVSAIFGGAIATSVEMTHYSSETALATANFFSTNVYGSFAAARKAGQIATPLGGHFSVDNGYGILIYYLHDIHGITEFARSVTPTNLSSPQGAQRIGFKQSVEANTEYLDTVIRRIGFYPQSYGAAADGETDDADAINTANDAAEVANGKLILEGLYMIKSPLRISVPIEPRLGAKIIIGEDFRSSLSDTIFGSAIRNKYISLEFNHKTALYWEISSKLEIEMRSVTNRQVLTLGNINGGAMDSPFIWTNTSARVDALIDFHACCRNIDVYNAQLSNITGASGGASTWIRAITTDPTQPENDTYGIRFRGGNIRHATGDEALAVFGVLGKTREIRIKDVVIETIGSVTTGARHSTLISAFPLNNGGSRSAAQGDLRAAVEDVIFDRIRIHDSRFLDSVYRTGREEDAFNVCRDVHIINSVIYAEQASARTSSVIRHVPCVGQNVSAENITVIANSGDHLITDGVVQLDLLTRSSISGNINNGVVACDDVINNRYISGIIIGVDNCRNVVGNELIQAPAYPIQVRSSAYFSISRNKLLSTNTSGAAAGLMVNSINGTVLPSGLFEQNHYDCSGNSDALLAATTGPIGPFDILRNIGTGGGFHGLSERFRRVEGNDRFGTVDPESVLIVDDADVSLRGNRYQIVVFDKPISAQRLVTTPDTNTLDGQHFRLIRTAAATGDFEIVITGGVGALAGPGWIDAIRIGGAWIRAGQGA